MTSKAREGEAPAEPLSRCVYPLRRLSRSFALPNFAAIYQARGISPIENTSATIKPGDSGHSRFVPLAKTDSQQAGIAGVEYEDTQLQLTHEPIVDILINDLQRFRFTSAELPIPDLTGSAVVVSIVTKINDFKQSITGGDDVCQGRQNGFGKDDIEEKLRVWLLLHIRHIDISIGNGLQR